MKIVLIGSGNVGTHVAAALNGAGHTIVQVYSRTLENARLLAEKTDALFTNDIGNIIPDADVYIFSVKDDALPRLLASMPETGGIWLHTAGSLPVDVFRGVHENAGVLYPLQTFSKNRSIDFSKIPLFIEAVNERSKEIVEALAKSLSENVRYLSGEKRVYLHLAAVFACNFTNHMYTLAADVLRLNDLLFDVLLPLIAETAAKVKEMAPCEAQTGPAVRFDEKIIDKQLQLIEDDQHRKIYRLISESIHKHSVNNDKLRSF